MALSFRSTYLTSQATRSVAAPVQRLPTRSTKPYSKPCRMANDRENICFANSVVQPLLIAASMSTGRDNKRLQVRALLVVVAVCSLQLQQVQDTL